MEYAYELKIPRSRVAVLIGKGGEVKRYVETATKTKIKVDSDEGDVFLKGEDALGLYAAREVVLAIGRGFNPEVAQLLLKGDYVFEQINLADYAKTKNSLTRLKGRIIGAEGKCRRLIEELSESHVCVFGKTVGIIGESESTAVTRHAIEQLLRGSQHSTVYKWLEKKRRDMKRKRIIGEAKIR
jgi:ribosomal RNA assembly protein